MNELLLQLIAFVKCLNNIITFYVFSLNPDSLDTRHSKYSYHQLQFSAVSGDFGLKICKIYGYDFSGTSDIFIIKQHVFEILYYDSWYTHYVQERHLTAMFKFKSNLKLNLHTLNEFVGNTRITTCSTKQTTLLQSTFFIILFISLRIIKTSHNTCQHKFTYGFFSQKNMYFTWFQVQYMTFKDMIVFDR